MSEEKQEEKKLTPEEIESNRLKLIGYYTRQIEVLDLQSKHESLMADIETSRARRTEMIIRQAQMLAPPDDTDPDEKESKEKQTEAPEEYKRVLKKT